jgi:hypothetical protein
VSGLHIQSLASDHGWNAHAHMPHLDGVARSNLSYSTFFTHQRRTNRGVYSVLCGDLPTLKTGLAKMSAYVEGGRVCLPDALRREGYETVYLQAAPLAFMMKDQFMARVGFDRVIGHKWFERNYAESRWGVDDLAMFEQSTELIEELQQGERPWFLTLLTVGTHHPYIFPKGFQQGKGTDEQRSLAFLDLAIGGFQKRLNEAGVPKNTLIVFTSDESSAMGGRISQNWGHLVVRTPDRARHRVREPFGQMDIALSVLDYLGLGDQGSHLFGRSVFRRYSEPRWTFFSNTNLDYIGARTPEGQMLLCSNGDALCERFLMEDNLIFGRSKAPQDSKPEDFALVKELVQRSIASRSLDLQSRSFEMMADPTFVVDVPEGIPDQMISGGQYVEMKVGEWVEVDMEVHASGESGAKTAFVHYIRSRQTGRIRRWIMPVAPGETIRLHYTFAPAVPIDTVQTRTYATRESDEAVVLEFTTARMTHHRSGDPPEFGIQVETKQTLPTPAQR